MLIAVTLTAFLGTLYILFRPRRPVTWRYVVYTTLRWLISWLLLAAALFAISPAPAAAEPVKTPPAEPTSTGLSTSVEAQPTEAPSAVTEPASTELSTSVEIESAATATAVPLDLHLLTIRLRRADGTAVSNAAITLQRLPDGPELTCRTDSRGRCIWPASRGLYQVLFDHPLDPVSSLAVAEGGLRGLGVTVGAAPITYAFILHTDAYVYFDAAPAAAIPQPIIPTFDEHHAEPAPTINLSPSPRPAATSETRRPEPAERAVSEKRTIHPIWPLIAGLLLAAAVTFVAKRLRHPKPHIRHQESSDA